MAVLKFDEVPFTKVKEGVQRKIMMTEELMTVLIDFSNGPWEMPDPPHSHPHQQTSYVELNPCGIAPVKYFPFNSSNKFKIIVNTFYLFRVPCLKLIVSKFLYLIFIF